MERSPLAVAEVAAARCFPSSRTRSSTAIRAGGRAATAARWRAIFGRNVRMGVEVALTRFLDGADEPRRARRAYVELGRGEFGEGRTLDALLAAYRVGARVAWRRAYEAGEEHGVDPRALYELGEAMFAYIDEISAESADGWAQAQSAAAGERQRARRRLALPALRSAPSTRPRSASVARGRRRGRSRLGVRRSRSRPTARGRGTRRDAPRTRRDRRRRSDGVLVAFVPDPDGSGPAPRSSHGPSTATVAALGPDVGWPQTARSAARARLALRLDLQRSGRLPRRRSSVADEHLATLAPPRRPALAAELAARRARAAARRSPPARARSSSRRCARGSTTAGASRRSPTRSTSTRRPCATGSASCASCSATALEDPEGRLALALALRAQ